MKRRQFLQILGVGSGTLLLGANATGCLGVTPHNIEDIFEQKGIFEPNVFLSIHEDGQIVLAMNKSEMGQGVMMSSVTLAAEELEVSRSQIEAVQVHKSAFGLQMTGGSTSMASIFIPIRKAAATAREMLRMAAAEKWGVPLASCIAKEGAIHHSDGRHPLSYAELSAMAVQQPVPKDPPLKSSKDFRLIGTPGQRVDALDKSTGRAVFGTDVQIDNKVCAYILRSPVMGGQAVNISFEPALKEPGVLDVVSYERGVAILANKFWQAKRAAKLVEVEWGEGQVEGFNTSDLATAARAKTMEKGDFTIKEIGNTEKVLKSDAVTSVELNYAYPYLSHAPMEPQNCTALVDGEYVKIWVPTQSPTVCLGFIENRLGIPPENIEIEMTLLGGGFGRRSCVDFVQDAIQIARKRPGVPIQVQWTREEDMSLGYYRPQGACRMVGGLDDTGKIVSVHSHLVSQLLFPDIGEQFGGLFPKVIPEKMRRKIAYAATGYLSNTSLMGFIEGGDIATCKYSFPNFRYDFSPIHINVPVTAWRSVAHSYSTFIMETFIDHLALEGGQDPLSVRKQLLSEHPRYLSVLDAVVEHSQWGEPIEEGWGRGIAVSEFARSIVAQVVEAGIVDDEIVVRHVTCVVDCGLVINPDVVKAQMEGAIIYGLSMMREKIEFVDGVVQQRNFDSFPALRMHQTPTIDAIILSSENDPTGIGEICLPPVNAAVSNALYASTGIRLTTMPLQDAWVNRPLQSTEEVSL